LHYYIKDNLRKANCFRSRISLQAPYFLLATSPSRISCLRVRGIAFLHRHCWRFPLLHIMRMIKGSNILRSQSAANLELAYCVQRARDLNFWAFPNRAKTMEKHAASLFKDLAKT
jgi:hypothetical protein